LTALVYGSLRRRHHGRDPPLHTLWRNETAASLSSQSWPWGSCSAAAAGAPDTAAGVARPVLERLKVSLQRVNNVNVTVGRWLSAERHAQVLVEHTVIQRLVEDTCARCIDSRTLLVTMPSTSSSNSNSAASD
jgi:hypothetical protein